MSQLIDLCAVKMHFQFVQDNGLCSIIVLSTQIAYLSFRDAYIFHCQFLHYFKVVAATHKKCQTYLHNDSVTFALLANVLHEIDDRKRFINEIKRILKPEGRLAVVEWKKEDMEMGPPAGHRIGFDETIRLITEEGLSIIDEMEFAGAFFYAIVFRKQE